MPAAKPGERRLQILQTLAEMLQQPASEKITTAALAKRLGMSTVWVTAETRKPAYVDVRVRNVMDLLRATSRLK